MKWEIYLVSMAETYFGLIYNCRSGFAWMQACYYAGQTKA